MSERFRKRTARLSLALTMAVAAMAVFAGGAQAAVEHPYLGSIDGNETPAGEFEYPCGIAVDPAGYLYVASAGTVAIDIFNPQHEYVTSIFDEEGPCDMAVDSKGNIYVNNIENGNEFKDTVRFSPASYPPTSGMTYTESTFFDGSVEHENPKGVAVNPSNDHVYLTKSLAGNTTQSISEYEAADDGAGLISATIAKGLPALANFEYLSIAVYGANGNIYLTLERDGVDKRLAILNPDGTAVLEEIEGFTSPLSQFAPAQIAVNQASGNVLVNQIAQEITPEPATVWEFKPDGTLISKIGPTFGAGLEFIDSTPSGLAVDNSTTANAGNVYVGSGLAATSVVYEFGPLLVNPKPLTVTKAGTGSGTVSSSPLRIECGSKCSAEFSEGETATLIATPAVGSTFTGWSGCTSEAEGGKKCLVTIGATNAVTATFEPKPKFALSVSKAGTGAGSVTSSPAGIDCGATCSAEFEEGAEVTLSASAASGSSFTGWSGACTGTGACKVTVDAAKAVTATFTANASGGTTTTPPPAPTCATDVALCSPGTARVGAKAQVKSGKAALSVTCPGPGACSGKVTLTAKITTGKGKNKKTKKQTIGSASFSLTPGGSSAIQVKLSGPAKSAVAKGTLKASVSGTGVAAGSVKLSQGGGK